MRIIAFNYITSYFLFDILAIAPGLVTKEKKLKYYPFKLLRIVRIPRIMEFLK